MKYADLTDERKTKVAACKTPAEILAFAKDEGIELTDEQVEQVAGGDGWSGGEIKCPYCGSTNVIDVIGTTGEYSCYDCMRPFRL